MKIDIQIIDSIIIYKWIKNREYKSVSVNYLSDNLT